jgi:hypothetical protein
MTQVLGWQLRSLTSQVTHTDQLLTTQNPRLCVTGDKSVTLIVGLWVYPVSSSESGNQGHPGIQAREGPGCGVWFLLRPSLSLENP